MIEARPPDVRLLVPAIVAWAGCAALLGLESGWTIVAALVTAAVGLAGAVFLARTNRRETARVVILATVVTAIVLLALTGHRGARQAGPIPELAQESAAVSMRVTVSGDARRLAADDQRATPGALVRVRVNEIRAKGHTARVNTPVLVIGDESLMALRWADEVRLHGALRPAAPGADVEAIMRLRGSPERLVPAGALFRAAEHARSRLREAVDRLPPAARGLVPAMVIGDRSLTPREVADDMLATGLTHLSAVSGSNVTIVLAAVMFIARLLALPRPLRPVVGVVALAVFVILARPDPSVIRAGAMGAVGLLGIMSSRRTSGVPALAAAIVALLMIDPWLARSYGFALSVLATLGLLLFARPWGEALASWLPQWLRPVAFAVSVPVAAQVACGPVIVLLQGGIPVVGVLANLLAAPLVAPVTLAGLGTAVVALAHVPLAQVTAWIAGAPAELIAWIAHILASVPGGTLPWLGGASGAVLLTVLTAAAVVAAPAISRLGRRLGRRGVAVAIMAAAVTWICAVMPVPWVERGTDGWEFAACDVGQGDALVLASAHPGHAVLVDTGRDASFVDACLSALGVHTLDALVLTHYDADHVDGLPGAVRGRTVKAVVVSSGADTRSRPPDVDAVASAHGIDIAAVHAGDVLAWEGGSAKVLSPARGGGGESANDASLVLDVQTARLRILLLADIERDASARVLRAVAGSPTRRPIDVLKVSHHGSANVDDRLYRQIRARLAVISVGSDNDYGHPAPSVLRSLSESGIPVWRTDERGTIVVAADTTTDAQGVVQGAAARSPVASPPLEVRGVDTR